VRQGDHAASEVPAQIARVCAIGGLEPLDGCARNRVEASASIIGDNVVDRVSRMQMTSSVLVKSNLERVFRTAPLTFTLARVDDAIRITHDIAVAFRFPWALLVPVLALFNKRALATDLDSLRRALDEGHDLTARP
jgi:hypothetical protein